MSDQTSPWTNFKQTGRATWPNPTQTACTTCCRLKPVEAFSKWKVKTLKARMDDPETRATHETSGYIECRECSAPKEELQCFSCTKWLSTQSFSKAQRRCHDWAVCLDCRALQDEGMLESKVQDEEMLESKA